MTEERPKFGKWIDSDKKNKGRFKAGGKEFKNPVKGVRIPIEILEDLTSLAIEAFSGEFEDSMGQSHLEDAIKLLRRKYPGEQPQEVWRRDVARLVGLGVEAGEIADQLIRKNTDLMASIYLNSVTREGREAAKRTLENKIKEYWTSAPQVG